MFSRFCKSVIFVSFFSFTYGVNADGFYQSIEKYRLAMPQEHTNASARKDFAYTPLYLQVVGHNSELLKRGIRARNSTNQISYTPLYLAVTKSNHK